MPVMVSVIVSVVMNALTASAMPICRELGSKTIFKLKKGEPPEGDPPVWLRVAQAVILGMSQAPSVR